MEHWWGFSPAERQNGSTWGMTDQRGAVQSEMGQCGVKWVNVE